MRPLRPISHLPWQGVGATIVHSARTDRLCYGIGVVRRSTLKPTQHATSSPLVASGFLQQCRLQHDDHGPHKEYFQTPGRAPRPDLSPYDRGSQTPSIAQQPTGIPATRNQNPRASASPLPIEQPSSTSKSDSFLRRTIRSLLYATMFFGLGLTVGTAVVTWEYSSPLFEEGSVEEAELVEEVKEIMEDHPLVESLREDGWREINLDIIANPAVIGSDAREVVKGRSMIYQTLTGSKGLLAMKMFHHHHEEYSVLVFFTGFGIEGWPDVVHGGILTSMLEEGVQKHIEYYHGGNERLGRVGDTTVNVNFKIPVKPGETYAVLIPPATRQSVRTEMGMGFGTGITAGTDRLLIMPLFMQMGAAPVVTSNVMVGGHEVEYKIQIPSGGLGGEATIHAVAEVTMRVASRTSGNSILESVEKGNAAIAGSARKTDHDEPN